MRWGVGIAVAFVATIYGVGIRQHILFAGGQQTEGESA